MLLRMDRQDGHIQQTNEILRTVVDVQGRMLHQMELIYTDQQQFNSKQLQFNERQMQFNERQETFNERQIQFNERQETFTERQMQFNERQEEVNLGLLHELRAIRADVREVKELVLNNHEERLRRLEEFMRRAS